MRSSHGRGIQIAQGKKGNEKKTTNLKSDIPGGENDV